MRKFNAIIHCDDDGKPVSPAKATQTKYMWFNVINNMVTDEQGHVMNKSELTRYFLASSPEAKIFRREMYPYTDLDNTDMDYGSCRVFVEEWTCPICSVHNRHVDDKPTPPDICICRHCNTKLTSADIQEFEGVCQLEIDLNTMSSKVVRG